MAEGYGIKINDWILVGALAFVGYIVYKTWKPAQELETKTGNLLGQGADFGSHIIGDANAGFQNFEDWVKGLFSVNTPTPTEFQKDYLANTYQPKSNPIFVSAPYLQAPIDMNKFYSDVSLKTNADVIKASIPFSSTTSSSPGKTSAVTYNKATPEQSNTIAANYAKYNTSNPLLSKIMRF